MGKRYSDDWHRAHLYNPRDVVPESNMPGFPWLAEATLDGELIQKKMQVLQTLGDPYTDAEIEAAAAAVEDYFTDYIYLFDRGLAAASDLEPFDRMVAAIGKGNVISMVALVGDRIVAHASLLMRGYGCTRHVGRLRIAVMPELRHKRLGTWILLDLIQLGMDQGLDDIRADFVVGIEDAAIEAARKLDFFKVAVLPEYVKSPRGTRYDLQIMIKRLHRNWGDF